VTSALSVTIVMYAGGVMAVCLIAAARDRPRTGLIVPALIVLEASLALQVLLDATQIHRHVVASLATHIGYLVASMIVLPAAALSAGGDQGRWGSAVIAVGALVAAVISVRLHQTLGPARG
jgi:hypothetical protein